MKILRNLLILSSLMLGLYVTQTYGQNNQNGSGDLKVTSFPSGANVTVDGVDTGKVTPMSISLPVGDHTVVVSIPNSNWGADSRTFTVVSGNNDLSVTLLPTLTVGPQGPPGLPGMVATIQVGPTTTLGAGGQASVTNSGTPNAAILNFSIPQGQPGAPGTPGTPGTAATIQVGTTATLGAGGQASVMNSGTPNAAILNFSIPQGQPGAPGTPGTAATVQVGTTTTLGAGQQASVTNSGTPSAAILNFSIPQGPPGTTWQAMFQALGTNFLACNDCTAPTTLPGLDMMINVQGANAFVQINTEGGVQSLVGSTATAVPLDIRLIVDGGVFVKAWRISVNPPTSTGLAGESNWSFGTLLPLAQGLHRIQVAAAFVVGPGANVNISGGPGDTHQGEVDVSIINQ